MTTVFDSAIGLKKESAFGTYIAPDKFFEFTEESFKKTPTIVASNGRRYGERVRRGDRRVVTAWDVAGSFTTDLLTKGMGALFEAVLGVGVSTALAAPAFQQLFTPAAGDPVASYTIQKSLPFVGGATQPHSFVGMYATALTLAIAAGGIPTLQTQWAGKDLDTGQAFATPSFPTSTELYAFTHGAIVAGTGALTAPTTTALGTIAGGVVADVTDFTVTIDNGTSPGRRYLGGSGLIGKPGLLGELTINGSITVDYTSNALRDAFLAQTDLGLVLTFTHPSTIATAINPVIQLVVPLIRLDGDIPTDNGGQPISLQLGFTGLQKAGVQPVYVVVRTAETAI